MTRVFLLFTLLLVVVGCSHRRDAEVRKNLPGTWRLDLAFTNDWGSQSTFAVDENGDFICQTVSPSGVHTAELSGTFQVKDGFLIETITNTTQPGISKRLPFVSRAQIISADDHRLVILNEGTTNNYILRKDVK
jgi:hypothetical protein